MHAQCLKHFNVNMLFSTVITINGKDAAQTNLSDSHIKSSTDPSSIIKHNPCVLVIDDVLQQVEAQAKDKASFYLTDVNHGVQTEN